ncbi:hypothetical protein cyc_01975 [Cyclospora cayetanensis]|uniref:Uncharacterized protein n=1 Tax=Cyclospora cayetanensis TaxID=88456 RepID=A0A1D3CZJ2_9EIME|nr:hypothetical protein cyc_01975 [Cyclospora cayetanensis]
MAPAECTSGGSLEALLVCETLLGKHKDASGKRKVFHAGCGAMKGDIHSRSGDGVPPRVNTALTQVKSNHQDCQGYSMLIVKMIGDMNRRECTLRIHLSGCPKDSGSLRGGRA